MNCLDESNPLTQPDPVEPERVAEHTPDALMVAAATINAFKAAAEAFAAAPNVEAGLLAVAHLGGDFTDTPGPGEHRSEPIHIDCGCSFGRRRNLDVLRTVTGRPRE